MFQKTYKGNEGAPWVPLYTEPGVESKFRARVSEVYSQIEADLKEAVTLLQGWSRPSKEAINQSVANGILAMVYLTVERWADGEAAANKARQGLTLMSAAQYKEGFSDLSNSERMWGQVITSQTTTIYASFFLMMDNTSPAYAGALATSSRSTRTCTSKYRLRMCVKKSSMTRPVLSGLHCPLMPN